MDDDSSKLVRPKRGWWFDPAFVMSERDNAALSRILDNTKEDYVPAHSLAPGVGLAGALWSDLTPAGTYRQTLKTAVDEVFNRKVAWRQVKALAKDPDQPYNLRLLLLAEAGFGLVAGVKFHFKWARGLVLFFARETADIAKLKDQRNEDYIRSAADLIGTVVALEKPRRLCMAQRHEERKETRRRLGLKLITFIGEHGKNSLENLSLLKPEKVISGFGTTSERNCPSIWMPRFRKVLSGTQKKCSKHGKKCKGANVEPPPPFTNIQSLYTFLGVFISLLILTAFSNAIHRKNSQYGLIMGPIAALTTLQFALTAAPSSQPRNAILGQLISISIGMAMTYTNLPVPMRQSLGTAIAVLLMVRLGIIHPPAAAGAMIFASGGYHWVDLGIMLAANLIAIFTAVLINNMIDNRQYPTFWGFGYWCTHRKTLMTPI